MVVNHNAGIHMNTIILHDSDIREPLFDYLEEKLGKIRILEEKQTGRARADVVMVTEQYLYGIEIKSDADTYARLKKQVRYYDQFYDRNIVVVGSTHAAHVADHVPKWWGIISAEIIGNHMDFYNIREQVDNSKVQAEKKISILWRPELNRLLSLNGLHAYKQKSKAFVQKKLLEMVPGELLWPQVMDELFERDYNTIADEIEAYRGR